MKLNYQMKNGREYAKIPGKSYRKNGKVYKSGVVNLGRVIDKENNVFFSRERGIFTYDPVTNTYGQADESYSSQLDSDKRKRPKVLLDFGDSFFISELIKKMKYDEVISSIEYGNPDTLFSMIFYYILCNSANSHASIWYDGNFVQLLYPDANLTSQRISTFLSSIGRFDKVAKFFDAHIEWIKNQVCDDGGILIDSTGLPNSIHFPLTAISNHNGQISNEVRMTTVVQRNTGYPLLFRATPGNIVDLSTLTRTISQVHMRNVKVDFIIMDSIYFTNDNVAQLCGNGIQFLTRLSGKFKLYKDIVKEHLPTLKEEKNMVNYEGRIVYLKRVECKIGKEDQYDAYAYLGYDVERANDEEKKLLRNARKNKKNIDLGELHEKIQAAGIFILIGTMPFTCEEILPTYYTRQLIEQYFDVEKGSSKLTPLRVQSEEALRGHLMLSMIAATVNIWIQKGVHQIYENREEVFMTLRNQKCEAYATKVTTTEAQKKANDFYDIFDIECPIYLERNGSKLTPKYEIIKPSK